MFQEKRLNFVGGCSPEENHGIAGRYSSAQPRVERFQLPVLSIRPCPQLSSEVTISQIRLAFGPRENFRGFCSLDRVTSGSAAISEGQHAGVQRGGARQSCDVEYFLFVERLPRHQRLRESVQLAAVICQ